MDNLANADPATIDRLKESFHHWDDIDVHYRGEVLRSTGHGFSGIARATLLRILRDEALRLGVEIRNGVEVRSRADLPAADLIVAADGVASFLRAESAARFGTRIDERRNRFVWLGTTRRFPAFTFYFKANDHGLFRVHAYQYETEPSGEGPCSTFIVEATDETFRRAGLSETDEAATVAYCEALFRDELQGAALIPNRSIWRRFPTVVNERWHDGSMVLIGDAAHTAHFSVGSGTKLAMEDSIALAAALSEEPSIPSALARYERERRGPVESLQRAAQASLEWFEDTERYMETPPIQFGFNLVTRSLRITHEDLRQRDPGLRGPDRFVVRGRIGRSGGRDRALARIWRTAIRRDRLAESLHRSSPLSSCGTWCSRTGSWFPRCASTPPRTACPTTGTSFTSGAGRSAARAS